MDNAGYFNAAADMLRVGDFVLANAGVGVTPVHGVFVVVSNSGGAVDCANMTQFGATNSD